MRQQQVFRVLLYMTQHGATDKLYKVSSMSHYSDSSRKNVRINLQKKKCN
jgi:hypothetical protein